MLERTFECCGTSLCLVSVVLCANNLNHKKLSDMAEAEFETDLRDDFSSAAKFLESIVGELSSAQLLEFYSYYKQVGLGVYFASC